MQHCTFISVLSYTPHLPDIEYNEGDDVARCVMKMACDISSWSTEVGTMYDHLHSVVSHPKKLRPPNCPWASSLDKRLQVLKDTE